jgi:hypothetical protein
VDSKKTRSETMRDPELRRELERLAREYGHDEKIGDLWNELPEDVKAAFIRKFDTPERCPDFVPQAAIDAYAQSHKRMAITVCQYCGCDTRQFPWLLDKPSTCKVCEVLNR